MRTNDLAGPEAHCSTVQCIHSNNKRTLKNIIDSGELDPDSVIRKFRITAANGKSYSTKHYNLDAIVSVGYRVNSVRAMQFRQ
jgi:hypothetical protein